MSEFFRMSDCVAANSREVAVSHTVADFCALREEIVLVLKALMKWLQR